MLAHGEGIIHIAHQNKDVRTGDIIQGLLDLYNKEKEKVDKLQKENEELKMQNENLYQTIKENTNAEELLGERYRVSEEEKEAIEYWEKHIELLHYNTQFASEHYATILLNLIDRLQKELEEEKEKNNRQLQIDTAEEVLKWKSKYYLLSRKIDVVSKSTLEEYKQELEETKKHLNSNCNIALMDFGIDLINHILEGENK